MSEAQVVAERLRQQVEASVLSIASHAITATVSIGVAQASSSMNTIFDLIKGADHALYAAKHAGRNRVCAA
jgi:diguanylate cyclase (GGDEF)-like protein